MVAADNLEGKARLTRSWPSAFPLESGGCCRHCQYETCGDRENILWNLREVFCRKMNRFYRNDVLSWA
jgi:hypothetical protein